MNKTTRSIEDTRLIELARRHGMENSLFLGEALGAMLAIAWTALGSLGNWTRRAGHTRGPAA